jgi:hypothetical protein
MSTLCRLTARFGGSDALERFIRAFVDLERVIERLC